MFLINGERRQTVDAADRGFQYGDGLFETLAVSQGRLQFLQQHLKRLALGCAKLLLPEPDLQLLAAEAQQLAAQAEQGVVKIIITRGSGGRGYRQPGVISTTRVLGLYPYPNYPADYQQHGVVVRLCQQRVSGTAALAGVKHLNRLEQILARAEWQDEAIQEGLMLDNSGAVVEGTMSNLFVLKQGTLCTPALTNCGVAGIIREIVMNLAAQQHIPVLETVLPPQALFQADEIFLTNSVIGIWPVRQLEQQSFPVGAVTRVLQNQFKALCHPAA
ncbi:aminodeoxychorismate lyase [Methylomonas paludis]|uniref:Aminodeoxychorismate lyase n=1 Tax=Methylomonas paludis TaxID=1173101 RepID=A0A975R9J0_9GAMM|nr:aminodeoxychorismate lyase [Methylomonas paludis]QWF71480.1 aminodeoxychorismate lyase [Methylomonas paludis]